MPGVGPTVVEMPGVVLDMVLTVWLGVGVFPVLVSEVAVVSTEVTKVSAEEAVGAGVVGGDAV